MSGPRLVNLLLCALTGACAPNGRSPRTTPDPAKETSGHWVSSPPEPPLAQAIRVGDVWIGFSPKHEASPDQVVALASEGFESRWFYSLTQPLSFLEWAVYSPKVLVFQLSGDDVNRIVAVEPRSGTLYWRSPGHAHEALLVAGVLVTSDPVTLRGRRALTGEVLWERDALDFHAQAASDRWLVAVSDEAIHVLDPESGAAFRDIPLTLPEQRFEMTIENDTLYLVRWGNPLLAFAVDLRAGKLLWQSRPLATPVAVAALALGESSVFACTVSSVVIGWHKATGAQRFTRGVPGCYDFTVAPGPPEELSTSPQFGSTLWRLRPTPDPSTPTVVSVSGRVVDEQGHPVPGAEVVIGISTALSDGQGRYSARIAFPGQVCASASKGQTQADMTCIQPSPDSNNALNLHLLKRDDEFE